MHLGLVLQRYKDGNCHCPLMSIYVHLCPLIFTKTHYSKHLQNRIFAYTCNSLLVIWRRTAVRLYNRETNPLPVVLRNQNRQQSTCGLVVSWTSSLKTTRLPPKSPLSVVCCPLSCKAKAQCSSSVVCCP